MEMMENTIYKETEIGLIPEDWEVSRLGEIAEIATGQSAPQGEEYFKNGKYPFIRVSHLSNEGYKIISYDLINDKAVKDYNLKIFSKDSIVFPKSGASIFLEKRAKLSFDAYIVSHLCIVNSSSDDLNQNFLFYTLINKKLAKDKDSNYPTLNINEIKSIQIPLPPLPEQKAIATVLDKIRQAIEQTEEVIKETKELKKSLMKHLFTYGVVPFDEIDKVKLKETEIGLISEHWEVKKLGELSIVKGGKRLPKGHKFAEEITKYPYLRVSDFRNGKVKRENLKYLTEEDAEILKNYRIFEGEIYISIAGTIGLSGIIPKELNGAYLTENAAKIIIDKIHELNSLYLVYVFNSHIGKFQIESNVSKTSQPKLALSKLKQFQIPIPPIDEQKQIAEILSKVDQKIEAEENKKQALEQLFKTLLNNLMTGKIRLDKNFIKKFEEK